MRKIALAAAATLVPLPALAGSVPGPEMGDGLTGIVVLAAVAAGYLIFRRVRAARSH
jgi:hypothetical protein